MTLTNTTTAFGRTISYPFYLWHLAVILLVMRVGLRDWPAFLAVMLAATLVGYLSHRFVEAPGMRADSWVSGHLAQRRRRREALSTPMTSKPTGPVTVAPEAGSVWSAPRADTLCGSPTYTASPSMSAPSAPSATAASVGALIVRRTPLADIPRSAWDRLLAVTARPTPFSRWTVHQAWWDAYGSTAHEQYLVCGRPGADAGTLADDDIVAIVPLMHRHEVEPEDAASFTTLRRPADGTPVRPDATAIFMAASYHADYATILCQPDDLAEVCSAVVASLAAHDRTTEPWDVIDLRRLRDDDPALPALLAALSDGPAGWTVVREQEDVCPVVTLPHGGWEEYLGSLDKKARHEIRRKLRRAEASGEVRFTQMPLDASSIDAFIDLHQKRWGEHGLFPATEGGDRSRRFLHRVTELEAAEGDRAQLQLGQVHVGDRLIFAGVGFDDGQTCFFYNAGSDTDARELSPGVTGAAAYIRDRIEAGRTRFDFLRGNEPYKYEWGAVDEPVHRIVVSRGLE